MNVADIFAAVHLNLETGKFETDALKSTDLVAGKMGDKLKTALAGAIGAGLGLAFGAALTGAKELDTATKQLQADTGMTAEAAGKAETAIARMYESNLQSYTQVGAAMAVVINGLDLTGDAATAMTQKFLTFATATKQDAAPAVSAFHEILNAWSLDASAAPHIMDLLTASHQKYGSSVTDNEAALRKLAPQMIALGMTVDDTVGLLNLFDAAGMDSSKAMFALNTAVKNLKPGETLNDLIKQVSSIEDPTLRAQEAIKLFGARGGVNLANALKPGTDSLDQFKTSAAENADATTKAADAVKSGFDARATLLIHQFGGALAELGTNFGPLIYASAALGPGLTRGITTALGGLIGLMTAQGAAGGAALVAGETAAVAAGGPAVAGAVAAQGPAATTAGSALGRLIGLAAGAAIPLGLAGLVAAGAVAAIEGGAAVLDADSSRFRAAQLALAKRVAAGLSTTIGDTSMLDSMGIYGSADQMKARAQAYLDSVVAGQKAADLALIVQKMTDAPGVFEADNTIAELQATAIASKKGVIDAAVKAGYSGVPTVIQASMYLASQALLKGMDDQVTAIQSKKSAFTSAFSDAVNASAGPADRAIAEYQARCAMVAPALLDALKSGDATEKRQAQLQLQSLQEHYFGMLAADAEYGTNAERIAKLNGLLSSKELLDGLNSPDNDTVLFWQKAQATAQAALLDLTGIMGAGGTNAANALNAAFLKGIADGTWAVKILSGVTITSAPVSSAPVGGSPGGGGSTYRPMYATGGFLAANHSAYAGEAGIEQIDALAGGGVRVTPLGAGAGVTNIFQFPHYVGTRSELMAAITKELRLQGG